MPTILPATKKHLPLLPHRQVLESDTFYEFLVDEASGRWQHWRERIPRWEYPAGVERPRFPPVPPRAGWSRRPLRTRSTCTRRSWRA